MNLQVRHCSERRARELKIGELTVYGLNFRNLLKFLKNLNFFGREVVSKLAMRVFPLLDNTLQGRWREAPLLIKTFPIII